MNGRDELHDPRTPCVRRLERRVARASIRMPRAASTLVALAAAVASSACVPLATHVYVADATAGRLVHSSCTLDRDVPDGIEVERGGVRAIVRLGPFSRTIEARYDVPPGRTLVLTSDRFRIDPRDGRPVSDAVFPRISRVDAPARNYDNPYVQSAMVSIGAPLEGGISGPGAGSESWKHYWIAAPLDVDAREVVVTLPAATVDGASIAFPDIRFERRFLVAMAPLNC